MFPGIYLFRHKNIKTPLNNNVGRQGYLFPPLSPLGTPTLYGKLKHFARKGKEETSLEPVMALKVDEFALGILWIHNGSRVRSRTQMTRNTHQADLLRASGLFFCSFPQPNIHPEIKNIFLMPIHKVLEWYILIINRLSCGEIFLNCNNVNISTSRS